MSRSHHHDAVTCNHTWERRADLDARRVLRFACSRCDVLGFRGLSPREPVHPYPDGRTSMPEFFGESEPTAMTARQRFFSNPSAVKEWLERKAWREMLNGGCA